MSTVTAVDSEIVGREEELETMRAFVAGIDAPRALILEGEPGIGKTTLWQTGVRVAGEHGHRVLSSRPSGAETKFSYAALADLLGDVSGELRQLPPPQRRALEVALLLREAEEEGVDAGAVAAGFLSLVRNLARSRPVLLAVDDVQWLDGPTAAVVEFAVRRLREEPVGLLLALRLGGSRELHSGVEGALQEQQLQRVRLAGLSLGALHRLLRDRLDTTLPRLILSRLHETARGNPFYALELARALEHRDFPLDPGQALPVPDTLQELVRERLSGLPVTVRDLLPALAALADPRVSGLPPSAGPSLEAAVEAGVLELAGDRIRFTHPLFASAVYAKLPPHAHRELHRRLAEIVSTSDERARHLALSSDPPDEEVASALEGAARSAAARGAPHAAAELVGQALLFTPPEREEEDHRRRIAAGEYHFAAGDTSGARALLEEAVAGLGAGQTRSAALIRLAQVVEATEGNAGTALYEQALREANGDASVCATAHWRLAGSVVSIHRDVPAAAAHARAAVELAGQAGDRGLLALALAKATVLDFYLGRGIDREAIERALALEDDVERVGIWLEEQPSTILGAMMMYVVDFDAAMARFESMRTLAAESGNERALPVILFWLSRLVGRIPDFERARALSAEGHELASQTGQEQIQAQLLFSLASAEVYLGELESAREHASEGLLLAERTGDLDALVNNLHTLGLAGLSVGDHAEAHRYLRQAAEVWLSLGITDPRAHVVIPDAVEAAAAVGEAELAEQLLEPYERRAAALGRGWPRGAALRCRGHLAAARGDLEQANEAFARSLPELEEWTPHEVARTLLALGQTQRRTRHRGAARESLERAAAIFDRIGAVLWADRVRMEIARVGGRTRAASGLTETEQRVAALVAQGHSNKEVAAALYVTPRTVEGHLSHIYAKLGVRSRSELAHRLSGAGASE